MMEISVQNRKLQIGWSLGTMRKKKKKRVDRNPTQPDKLPAGVYHKPESLRGRSATVLEVNPKKWESRRDVLDKVTFCCHNVRPRIRNQSSGRIAQMVRAQL